MSAMRILPAELLALLHPLRQRCSATSVDSNNYRAINSKIDCGVIVNDVFCSRTDVGVAEPLDEGEGLAVLRPSMEQEKNALSGEERDPGRDENRLGYADNQWQTAALQPKHLAAICTWEGAADFYRDMAHHGGIFCNGFTHDWSTTQVYTVQNGRGSHGLKSRMTGGWVSGPETLSEEE